MGKRSNFERKPHDFYPTPYEAVLPLLPHLSRSTFIEPCAGDGRLIAHLEKHGHKCAYACDIEPQADGIEKRDVLFFGWHCPSADFIITNPPWERDSLHRMIFMFKQERPTWLLFDADWMHTTQAAPFLKSCSKIISIGRISWEGNGVSGMDNCCWYLFQDENDVKTEFISR